MKPHFAIVTTCYGHPELMQQALYSAIDQVSAPPFKLVIVNDGCRFGRTNDFARLLKRRYANLTKYVRTPNRGLGAARNRAVDYVLSAEPDISWFFFLDADNFMTAGFLKNASAEIDRTPNFDWYYFSKIPLGGTTHRDHSGEYSFLEHMVWNVSDAGSVVSRRIFEAGLRFDSSFGFEDWQFFLSAFSKGFRGTHIENPGFLYRERPASMVTDVGLQSENMRSAIRESVKDYATYETLLSEESRVTPRWAFLNTDEELVTFSDPRVVRERMTLNQGMEALLAARSVNRRLSFPAYLAVGCQAVWDAVKESRLLNWLLWWHESKLEGETQLSVVRLLRSDRTRVSAQMKELRAADIGDEFHVLIIRSDSLVELASAEIDQSTWRGCFEKIRNAIALDLELPNSPPAAETNHGEKLGEFVGAALQRLRATIHLDPGLKFGREDTDAVLDRQHSEDFLRDVLHCKPVFSWAKKGRRSIGLVLPFANFGDVERVALNTAQVLHESGYDVHVFVTSMNESHLPQELLAYVSSINFLDDASASRWQVKGSYFGTRESSFSHHGNVSRMMGLLAHVDAIVNYHSSSIQSVLGALRRKGVKTISAPQVMDCTGADWIGRSYEAIAFEHGYDRILAPSNDLTDWLVAHGIPREKILFTPNCPGFSVPPEMTKNRQRVSRETPLNALFIGRPEYQTELDHLVEIIEQGRRLNLPVEWRIIEPINEGRLKTLVRVEEPKRTDDERCEALVWADVVLFPGRFEGVPLTMLEAMAAGSVVIAIDAGGVAEFLTDETGFVVSQDDEVASRFVSILSELSVDRQSLEKKSHAAQAAAAELSWQRSLVPLLDFLKQELK